MASNLPKSESPERDQVNAGRTGNEHHTPSSRADEPLKQPQTPFAFKILILLLCLVFLALVTGGFLRVVSFGIPGFLKDSATLKGDALVKELRRAVVKIKVVLDEPGGRERMGSGFNLEPEGMIITNRHIIEDAAIVRVGFPDGGWYTAHSWFEDPVSDLAVVYLTEHNLPTVVLSDEPPPYSGDKVFIIGSPLGAQGIAMRGIVSCYLSLDGESVMEVHAPICSGSSGSPVFDTRGRVVSVVFAAVNENTRNSRGLAIPTSRLREFLEDFHPLGSGNRNWPALTILLVDSLWISPFILSQNLLSATQQSSSPVSYFAVSSTTVSRS